jgi:putative ABC transport system substrate-binding protein
MNNRRKIIMGLGASALGQPLGLFAQEPKKVRRIGYLSAPTRASVERAVDAFLVALNERGWVDGKNLGIDYRWAEGNVERLPALAAELVRQKVELIVAPASSAALAAKNATTTTPIVMMFPTDPVAAGLVASLRRPGGNVTGTSFAAGTEIFGKQLQLLKEIIPKASRMAILTNPAIQDSIAQVKQVKAAALALNVQLQRIDARGPEEFGSAFAAMAREKAEALLVGNDATFLVNRDKIAAFALKAKLPTMCSWRENVEAGGLIGYSVNMIEFIAHAAGYVDKILRGARPADLPVEQPTKFELVINMKTAGALGIKMPNSVLLRADKVIE